MYYREKRSEYWKMSENGNVVYSPSTLVLRFIEVVLVIFFCIGTVTHLSDVFRMGFFGYSSAFGVPRSVNVFWTALLFIDPLVVFLLLKYRITGTLAAVVVLVADVAVNAIVGVKSPFVGTQFALQCGATVFTVPAAVFMIGMSAGTSSVKNVVGRVFSSIPIVGITVGLLLHLRGFAEIAQGNATLWTIWVHVSMTLFDVAMLIGLALRLRLAFITGVVAASLFGLLQLGFAVANSIGTGPSFTIPMGITAGVCILAIAALLNDRQKMVRKTGIGGF
ncbi:MAG: hypothetical protein JW863_15860 [Chitinispirillaceae bacterium]|nr:hypothetical protein [Chitinispirillaceae bacterium]